MEIPDFINGSTVVARRNITFSIWRQTNYVARLVMRFKSSFQNNYLEESSKRVSSCRNNNFNVYLRQIMKKYLLDCAVKRVNHPAPRQATCSSLEIY